MRTTPIFPRFLNLPPHWQSTATIALRLELPLTRCTSTNYLFSWRGSVVQDYLQNYLYSRRFTWTHLSDWQPAWRGHSFPKQHIHSGIPWRWLYFIGNVKLLDVFLEALMLKKILYASILFIQSIEQYVANVIKHLSRLPYIESFAPLLRLIPPMGEFLAVDHS